MNVHLGDEKNSVVDNSRNCSYPKKIQTEHGESVIFHHYQQGKLGAKEWKSHPLDPVYLIIWVDGIVFKVRDNSKIIINKIVYLCVGLKQNGLKEVLGMWGDKSEIFFLDGCAD